jgi:CheY-like chemotaxis protein
VLGQGTTISLVLPSSQGLAELEQPQPQTEVDAGLAGLRVLLVEDNEAVSETTLTLLDSFGCHVGRAGNAAAALQAIGDDPAFDVVLSDVVMPGSIDGVGLARALRQRFPTLPVVLITGFARSLDDAGDVEVLRKPCTAQALAEALRRARTRVAA